MGVKRKIDKASIEYRTQMNRGHVDSIRGKLKEFDDNKAGRDGLCKYCSYINTDRIGGCAMTEAQCGICDKVTMFASTNVDALCIKCAAENDLCHKCGGDIDMKARRKPRPFEAAP